MHLKLESTNLEETKFSHKMCVRNSLPSILESFFFLQIKKKLKGKGEKATNTWKLVVRNVKA